MVHVWMGKWTMDWRRGVKNGTGASEVRGGASRVDGSYMGAGGG